MASRGKTRQSTVKYVCARLSGERNADEAMSECAYCRTMRDARTNALYHKLGCRSSLKDTKKTRHATYIGSPRSITLTAELESWLQAKVKGGKSFCAVVREELYKQMERETAKLSEG